MRNRRDRRDPNHIVLFITNRIYRGLPLLPCQFMNEIITGIMAKSQDLYPVQICHFLWMSNHYHMIVAGRAKFLSNFICQMQSEIAKAVIKFFPNYKGKVWENRFKEQRLCTPEDVMDKIVYTYANPVKAGLVKSAADWTGCSSYKMFLTDSNKLAARWTPSRKLKQLPPKLNRHKELSLLKELRSLPHSDYELVIQPYVWKKCFEESKSWNDEEIRATLQVRIKKEEETFALLYKNKFKGIEKIKYNPIDLKYTPEEKDKTPYLICYLNDLRIKLIADYKEFCARCTKAWEDWKQGKAKADYVFGAYRPSMPIANIQLA